MQILVVKDYDAMSQQASHLIAQEMKKNPCAVLGLATGSTPIGTYKELIRMYREEHLDFSRITTFNLDEYAGLDTSHPNSYSYYMRVEFFDHINIKKENTHIPDGKIKDLNMCCRYYDQSIEQAGGIDFQLLGIGPNGHIAFIEPDEALSVHTNIVTLTKETIAANSRFFSSPDEVPRQAISMGVGSILQARKIVLLANGVGKAQAIKNLLASDKVSTQIPASFLYLHPQATIIVDEAAYSLVL
ncbi:MAG: glucosamine-6-phosphate deaminase [Desulfovibrionales bacterium]|jgi:glucosamine-6-phosphate deaminase|nr:glucosamine-6-phosphate deaminase [Desulfovibrionales bacterium]